MWFWNLLGWILGSIIVIFVGLYLIGWIIGFMYAPIKEYFEKREERKIADKEREEQWKRVSKELKESGFSLDAREKEMTPEEKAEYDKRMAKIKKDKKILIIALIIIALLMLPGMIISLFD